MWGSLLSFEGGKQYWKGGLMGRKGGYVDTGMEKDYELMGWAGGLGEYGFRNRGRPSVFFDTK